MLHIETLTNCVRSDKSTKEKDHPSAWHCWVIDDGKQLLGHVCVQLCEKMPDPVNEPEAHAYLTNFYVVPEMRGRGLGRKLLNKALTGAARRARTQ
jgi:GNAT superfamily N-acetyltransferase